MKWPETVTSVAGICGVLVALYLNVIDGLSSETMITAILVIAGLGGYRVLRDYYDAKNR
jgi:hypothetical protein